MSKTTALDVLSLSPACCYSLCQAASVVDRTNGVNPGSEWGVGGESQATRLCAHLCLDGVQIFLVWGLTEKSSLS